MFNFFKIGGNMDTAKITADLELVKTDLELMQAQAAADAQATAVTSIAQEKTKTERFSEMIAEFNRLQSERGTGERANQLLIDAGVLSLEISAENAAI
jgi:hypothetical protein